MRRAEMIRNSISKSFFSQNDLIGARRDSPPALKIELKNLKCDTVRSQPPDTFDGNFKRKILQMSCKHYFLNLRR